MSALTVAAMAVVLAGCVNEDLGDMGSLETTSTTAASGSNSGGTASSVVERPPGLAAPLPEARTEVAGTLWRGQIVVVGGLSPDGVASPRVDFYDPATDVWSGGPPLPVGLHHTAAVTGPKGRLWVVGGYSIEGETWVPRKEVLSLGADDSNWKREPDLLTARGALGVATVGRRIVAVGGAGQGDGSPEAALRSVEQFEPGATAWEYAPDLFEPREHLAVTMTGDRVLVMGGRRGGIDTNLRSVESWSPGEPSWRREVPLKKARGGTAAGVVDGTPCIAGGEEPGGTIAEVGCLVDGSWKTLATLSEPRHGLAVVGIGKRLHVIAGGPQPGLFVSAVHEVLAIDP